MSATSLERRCPACGKDNACGMNGEGPCWCATEFSPRIALATEADAACYCRDCLRKLIEALPDGSNASAKAT